MKCPVCGASMKKRQNSQTDEWFYGCSNYPACKGTREISEYEKLREMGAKTLFDDMEAT